MLTQDEQNTIDVFYAPYYFIRHSAHDYYKSILGVFDKRFIPNGVHSAIIDQYFNDWGRAAVIDNKCYYPVMFKDVSLPQMIVYRMGGFWYNKDGCLISPEEAFKDLHQYEELFVKKATDSWGGLGVHYFNKMEETFDELVKFINDYLGDIVIQECIRQSEILAALNRSSVNTVRIMTRLMYDGNVKIQSAILRMGIKGAKVDNASSGGISTGIQEDGRLKSIAYSNTGDKYEVHPSSGVKFSEVVIPNYNKMKEMVIMLQKRFPHFRLISWDLAAGENDEPILIEANLCDGELDFHQLNNGPIFGDETEEILKEVFSHSRRICKNKFKQFVNNIIGAILHENKLILFER